MTPQTKAWPAYFGGLRLKVPQSFPTQEAAQAWADQHVNKRTA